LPERQGEARLRAVVDTAVDGVILIDARGTVLLFNPACERLFGYAANEVIGQNVKMLMPPPFHGEHDGYLGNYRRSGVRKIIGIGREVVGKRKDGSTFPMDLSVGEAKDVKGSFFVGIIHDLTTRNAAERAIREGAAQLKAVVETAVDGVILIDAKGRVLMFNPACERMFGYSAAEVIGQNVKMLMPSPYHEEHHRTAERKIIGIGREVMGRRKDATTFPMDLSVGEAKQADGPVFVGIIHDVTERKRTAEQLIQAQKMETVGQLAGGIAHDFNNLLTVIIGNADELRDRLGARPDLKNLADTITTAGVRGAELTQRLLAFSRRQALRPTSFDCNALIDSMQRLLTRTLREDVEFKTMLDGTLWRAFADPAQLESAILNLTLNAQDAMPKGGRVTVSTSNLPLHESEQAANPEVKPGNYVVISVTDDGSGMPPDVLKRVFEPFFTTKEVGKGTGLGLSMVYGFCKQSGGSCTIYSDVGLGTTVRLYLPADPLEAAKDGPALARDNEPAQIVSTDGKVVLLVEDDPFVRIYGVTSLQSLGYQVIAAVDGRDGLAKLGQEGRIDILFSDIVMPGGMNGRELAEMARTVRPGIKVLLTSGYAIETLAGRGKLPDDVMLLSKPYRKADLARALQQALAMA